MNSETGAKRRYQRIAAPSQRRGRQRLLETPRQRPPDLAELQRARLVLATIDAAGALPLAEVSVLEITTRAGVSRKTFYELFDQRGDCMLAALESTVARLTEVALPAYEGERSWARRVRAGLAELLRFCDGHPAHGRFCVRAAFDDDVALRELRAGWLSRLALVLDAGRAQGAAGAASPLSGETLVGAVLATLHRRLLAPSPPPCIDLLNPLMSMIVLPFKGAAAARAELQAPPPARPAVPAETIDNPLEGVQTRLTYRTLRVLRAIEQLPGASNGAVAEAAGLGDLGQASKLLKRLERLDLVVNDARRAGEPNAWRLTARADRMLATISKAAVPRATRRGA